MAAKNKKKAAPTQGTSNNRERQAKDVDWPWDDDLDDALDDDWWSWDVDRHATEAAIALAEKLLDLASNNRISVDAIQLAIQGRAVDALVLSILLAKVPAAELARAKKWVERERQSELGRRDREQRNDAIVKREKLKVMKERHCKGRSWEELDQKEKAKFFNDAAAYFGVTEAAVRSAIKRLDKPRK